MKTIEEIIKEKKELQELIQKSIADFVEGNEEIPIFSCEIEQIGNSEITMQVKVVYNGNFITIK